MSKHIYIDIETVCSAEEVGGWFPERMGFAIAVTYDDQNGYEVWEKQDKERLISKLLMPDVDRIIGFNIINFDLKLLAYLNMPLYEYLKSKSFDLLSDIYSILGYRIKLDDLAFHNLNRRKIGDGLDSIKWWREGLKENVITYCKNDVEITYELHQHGIKEGKIKIMKYQSIQDLKVNWDVAKKDRIASYKQKLFEIYKESFYTNHSFLGSIPIHVLEYQRIETIGVDGKRIFGFICNLLLDAAQQSEVLASFLDFGDESKYYEDGKKVRYNVIPVWPKLSKKYNKDGKMNLDSGENDPLIPPLSLNNPTEVQSCISQFNLYFWLFPM